MSLLPFLAPRPLAKARKEAANALSMAGKVWRYRNDVLPTGDREALRTSIATLKHLRKTAAAPEPIQAAIKALEPLLVRTGGNWFPRTQWTEWVEMFFIAAVLIIGMRAYFLQPFKIPTNSMWPTYHGMTHEIYRTPESEPNVAMRAVRFALLGADSRKLIAPADGELFIPLDMEAIAGRNRKGPILAEEVRGTMFFVIPTPVLEYEFIVGDKLATVRMPKEFPIEEPLADALSGGERPRDMAGMVREVINQRRLVSRVGKTYWATGRTYRKGETIFSFDILTGDALFVDRFSYHFWEPAVGDPFVFRTKNIPNIDGAGGPSPDQYYIKRLVGREGDRLRVEPPVLYRNGEPIAGCDAFAANNEARPPYRGYTNAGFRLAFGMTQVIPEDSYWAMGDNSGNSLDSRFWGPVPKREVVGKAFFIYHPITHRWGLAK